MKRRWKKGQIAHSAEVQTVFVLLFALAALTFTGKDTWRQFVNAVVTSFSHLHDTDLTASSLQGYAISGVLVKRQLRFWISVVLGHVALGGLLAGKAIQNKFNTASEALTPDWNRVNPVAGFKRTADALRPDH